MNVKPISVLALVAASMWIATSAFAQNLDFTLVNRTGYTIEEVYVSSSKSDDWEEDVMGRDVLEDGESVDISFARGTKGCKWDLKVVYDDEEEAVWNGFDLCSISRVSLRYERKSGKTWAETR